MSRKSAKDRKRNKKVRQKMNKAKDQKLKSLRRVKYPDFYFVNDYADPDFVKITKQFLLGFDFHSELSERQKSLFQLSKNKGFRYALKYFCFKSGFQDESQILLSISQILSGIGNKFFAYLANIDKLDKYLPYNDFNLTIGSNVICVKFDSVNPIKTNGGIHYQPKRKPLVTLNKKEYPILFTKHSIHRIIKRFGRGLGYDSYGDVFATYSAALKYPTIHLNKNGEHINLAMLFSETYFNFIFDSWIPKFILDDYSPNKSYCLLLGYLPLSISNGYACAKTLLTPGMTGTPESDLISSCKSISKVKKDRLLKSVHNNTTFNLKIKEMDFEAIKWFHNNGHPQVLENDGSYYLPPFFKHEIV